MRLRVLYRLISFILYKIVHEDLRLKLLYASQCAHDMHLYTYIICTARLSKRDFKIKK